MKYHYLIIFLAVFFHNARALALDFEAFTKIEDKQNSMVGKYFGTTPEKISELTDFIDRASKEKKPLFVAESSTDNDCSHCPKHVQLAGSINNILEQMKKDPTLASEDEVPISINRLKFLYFTVKSREEDGSVNCVRYKENTPDLKATSFDGQMDLMAENVFKFDGAQSLQIMDPTKEEITYYYRGVGDQKNIIVQAILSKDGGKFRYYYYRPTDKEKNPYNLPSMGVAEPVDPTAKKSKVKPDSVAVASEVATGPATIESKNKFNVEVDPTVETKLKIIPKNVQVGKAEISQNIGGEEGLRVNANSNLSLKGNVANLNLQNEDGYQYIQVDVRTSLKGDTTRTITVPYEVKFGATDDKDALKVKGHYVDSDNEHVVTMSLTDSVTTYVRSEFKKDKLTNVNTYAVAKDFSIGKDEMATVAVGSNELKSKYVSFQHRKAIKDNLTMVLDMRIDDNKKASLTYQMKMRF